MRLYKNPICSEPLLPIAKLAPPPKKKSSLMASYAFHLIFLSPRMRSILKVIKSFNCICHAKMFYSIIYFLYMNRIIVYICQAFFNTFLVISLCGFIWNLSSVYGYLLKSIINIYLHNLINLHRQLIDFVDTRT